MKKYIRFSNIFLMIFMILTICGVKAIWKFYDGLANNASNDYNVLIEEFYYAENVPDNEESELSHNALLLKIIDKKEGINNPDSLLSEALKKRFNDNYTTVSSNQQVSGGNLRNTFSNVDGFENVGFLIVYVSDDVYEIYTYDNRNTTKTGSTISVFVTQTKYGNGEWRLYGGVEGTAEVCKY